MFRNYLVTALRSFFRHKLYSFINIAGLTVGFTCAVFIILLLRDELSFDKWIPGTENLYRIELSFHIPGQPPFRSNFSAFPMPDAMQAQIPEVRAAIHLMPRQLTVATGNRQFLDQADVVSPNFFKEIRLPLVQGDVATVFAQPESAVITESAARKYFGRLSPIGQTLRVGGVCEFGPEVRGCPIRQANVLVTGVVRDLPHNTQLTGDIFIPNTSAANPMSPGNRQAWLNNSGYGYVELASRADPKLVEKKFAAVIDRSVDLAKLTGVRIAASRVMTPYLTPFRDVHLTSDQYGGMTPGGNWTMVYGFAAIALLILLVACFNFTNLATARALVRAREISLRKVVGARRGQLVMQFLGESVLIALISLALALSSTEVLLPFFHRSVGTPIALHYLSDWPLTLSLLGLAILTGLAAGAYPALVLSGFRPALALRNNNAAATQGAGMVRTILVVVQFAVSIGLGIAALVVFAQISFAHAVDLGLDKSGIVVIHMNGVLPDAYQSMVRAMAADPALKGAAMSGDIPFSGDSTNRVIQVPRETVNSVMRYVAVGPDFFSIYGIKLLSGRALSWGDMAHKGSADNVIVNASAAKRFGFSPDTAVGKSFVAHDDSANPAHTVRATIVGVVADFMFEGDRRMIVPTLYSFDMDNMAYISLKVPAAGVPQALAAIDRIWHAFEPSIAINRHFLSADFERQFLADQQQGRIFGLFVGIAIFIAALGLFGLAAFSTERRTKEIGLRKTFGAQTKDIILLLLWQFSIPVLLANLIAWPITYYYLRHWLEGYAYRISLNPLYFLGAGLAALIIAWATVFVHARRVAHANPIHALRYE